VNVDGRSLRLGSVEPDASTVTEPLTTELAPGVVMPTVGAGLVTVTPEEADADRPPVVVSTADSECAPDSAVVSQGTEPLQRCCDGVHGTVPTVEPSAVTAIDVGKSDSVEPVLAETATEVAPTTVAPSAGEVIATAGSGFATVTPTEALAVLPPAVVTRAVRVRGPDGPVASHDSEPLQLCASGRGHVTVPTGVGLPSIVTVIDAGWSDNRASLLATTSMAVMPNTVAPTDGAVSCTVGGGFETVTPTVALADARVVVESWAAMVNDPDSAVASHGTEPLQVCPGGVQDTVPRVVAPTLSPID